MLENKKNKIFVINPGGTSTKVAVFLGEDQLFSENLRHSSEELGNFETVYSQLKWRLNIVKNFLHNKNVAISELDAVAGRGAPLGPVPSGTFAIDETMLTEIKEGRSLVQHPALLGPPLAAQIAKEAQCPAYIVDPVCVDEMNEESKICGLPMLQRRALAHSLNVKAASRKAAKKLGKNLNEINLIVAHLGSGFTIAAQKFGKQIDSNDATASGPMAPTRAGYLPVLDFARLCYSQKYTLAQMEKLLVGQGGWNAHLGTDDIREIYKQIENGEMRSRLVLDATILQVAKEIAGLMAVLNGKVDAIVLTGGVTFSEQFVSELKLKISWINAPVIVIPGENEMLALATGANSALNKQCPVLLLKDYQHPSSEKSSP